MRSSILPLMSVNLQVQAGCKKRRRIKKLYNETLISAFITERTAHLGSTVFLEALLASTLNLPGDQEKAVKCEQRKSYDNKAHHLHLLTGLLLGISAGAFLFVRVIPMPTLSVLVRLSVMKYTNKTQAGSHHPLQH